eukprot:g2723.t1
MSKSVFENAQTCALQSSWNQIESLEPCPYQGLFKNLIEQNGCNLGDAPVDDALRSTSLSGCPFASATKLRFPSVEPSWKVDWDQIKRGQSLWLRHVGVTFYALSACLLQGFVVCRFSEVLLATGYAASSDASWRRFRSTGFHIVDWFKYSLSDENSIARKSIRTVRVLHARARQSVRKRKEWMEEAKAKRSIPLSQIDLAEVLLAFSSICLWVLTDRVGISFTKQEEADMIEVWRVIGHHLGVLDTFNICSNVQKAKEYRDEFLAWNIVRTKYVRKSTHLLQRSVLDGFGRGTGLGVKFWNGWFCFMQSKDAMAGAFSSPIFTLNYSNVQANEAEISAAASLHRKLKSKKFGEIITKRFLRLRELWRNNPSKAKQQTSIFLSNNK